MVISGGFGPVQDFVFKSVRIGGSVTETDILAGYNGNGTPVNADTQIGPIFVGGAFTSSNIVSGVGTGADGDFGTEDDAALSGAGIANNPALFRRSPGSPFAVRREETRTAPRRVTLESWPRASLRSTSTAAHSRSAPVLETM